MLNCIFLSMFTDYFVNCGAISKNNFILKSTRGYLRLLWNDFVDSLVIFEGLGYNYQ